MGNKYSQQTKKMKRDIKYNLECKAFYVYCKKNNIRNFTTMDAFWRTTNRCRENWKEYTKIHGWHAIFDKVLGWSCTQEGHKFWLRHQLQFVMFLIDVAQKHELDVSTYIGYMRDLLTGYDCHNYKKYDWWQYCYNYFNKINI